MAEGVLGLGAGAGALNSDLITKLKAADSAAKVGPIETSLENIGKEKEAIANIKAALDAFMSTVKPLDLFVSGGSNTFNKISANSQGDSVLFDAEDINALKIGTTNITVDVLAKQDVFQTVKFSDKNALISEASASGSKITINGDDFETSGKTYQELADSINSDPKYEAAIEQVGTNDFRIIIKSKDLGEDNALVITQTDSDLGLNKTLNPENHVQTATNLDATINGVKYNLSTNNVTLSNGLKLTAQKVDTDGSTSSISLAQDNSSIEESLTNFAKAYNTLVATVESESSSDTSNIEDKASLRSMMTGIKNYLFSTYGSTDDGAGGYISDKSIFNFGFELGKDGSLTVDSEKLNKAISDDFEGLKDLFIGEAGTKARGLGTQLKEHIDFAINSTTGGILNSYENNIDVRKLALEKSKENAIESLDNKYKQMALEFAAYGSIIAKFESSFSGLKQMIAQSVSTG